MLEDLATLIWHNLIREPSGPLNFRFLLQPAVAIYLGIRSGLKDSRDGKPPFLWGVLVDRAHARWPELLRDAWQSISRLFLVAIALDCVYQIIVFHWIYPVEALVISTLLAILPYAFVRGPINRLVSRRMFTVRKPPQRIERAERIENDYATRR